MSAREGWRDCGDGDQGSCELLQALSELCVLVCGWEGDGGSLSISCTLVQKKVVIRRFPTPPPQLLQLVIDVYEVL